MNEARRRVLLVGGGARIKNSFLPALSLLADHIQATAVWSRTFANAQLVAEKWNLEAVSEIEPALEGVDVVMMSVAQSANPQVLARLEVQAPRLELIIDTPVLNVRDLATMRALRRFKRVLVGEDYMNFPQWELARRAIAAGMIGPVKNVQLIHSGYKYHGLALIRSLFGFDYPRLVRTRADDGKILTKFVFAGGRTATVVEPYDQSRGRTIIQGERGILTDDSLLGWAGRPIYVIEPTGDPAAPTGFAVGDLHVDLPQMATLRALDIDDVSVFNSLKTVGLSSIIAALWDTNVNTRYSYQEGLYDNLMTLAPHKLSLVVDPAAFLGRNVLGFRARRPAEVQERAIATSVS